MAERDQLQVAAIVPGQNETVVKELRELLPSLASVRAIRLPGAPVEVTETNFRQRIEGYLDGLGRVVGDLAQEDPVDFLWLGHTGMAYVNYEARRTDLSAALDAANARNTATAVESMSGLLRMLNATEISLLSPYPEWLTQLAIRYWEAHGYTIVEVAHIRKVRSVYNVTADMILDAWNGMKAHHDVCVISGTGVPTLAAVRQLTGIGVTTISANAAVSYMLRGSQSDIGYSEWISA